MHAEKRRETVKTNAGHKDEICKERRSSCQGRNHKRLKVRQRERSEMQGSDRGIALINRMFQVSETGGCTDTARTQKQPDLSLILLSAASLC